MEAYLIESRSIGGLSGSPVFAVDHKNRRVLLLGLIQGHYDVKDEILIDSAVSDSSIPAGINTGIAIITPATKLLEIVEREDVRKMCEQQEN